MSALLKYDDLILQWSRHQWRPHYLFAGSEDFLIEQAVHTALRHWLGPSPEALNLERLDADAHSAEEILQAAQTTPFFGGARVLSIRNASELSAKDQETLAETLGSLSPDTHCLFLWEKEWRRDEAEKPLVEALAQIGGAVVFWPLYPEQAERWALERTKQFGKRLATEAARWLIQQSGEGLRRLDQELAKCAAFVGGRPDITLEDVQTSFGYKKASSPYDWIAFIRQQKTAEALRVLELLLAEGEEPMRLLALLSRSIRDWLGTKGSGENAAFLAMRFHVRRGGENRFAQDLARWSESALVVALSQCVEAEQSIKTGKEAPEMALTLLTLGLGRGEPAYAGR